MRILFVCNKSPFPPVEGGPIAMNAIITGLINSGHQVKVLAVTSDKFKINTESIPQDYLKKTGLELVYISLKINPYAALVNLFSRKSYHAQRFIAKKFKKALVNILKRDSFDIVQFETIYMGSYIDIVRKYSNAKIIIRAHNIEHLIWFKIAKETIKPLRRKYIHLLATRLKRFEAYILNKADGVAAISSKDAKYLHEFGCRVPLIDVPFGIETNQAIVSETSIIPQSLFHIGSMNWIPNETGIRWFLKEVWPKVLLEFPKAILFLAGRFMPNDLLENNLIGVQVLGEVPDAMEFMRNKSLMIVPLFSGSGIRIKIIEGMWMKKPIISTLQGASGIQYTEGKDILIAETANDFLEKIKQCFTSDEFCSNIGNNAHQLVLNQHNNEKAVSKLEAFYSKCLMHYKS